MQIEIASIEDAAEILRFQKLGYQIFRRERVSDQLDKVYLEKV
jgi:hypothetical protein